MTVKNLGRVVGESAYEIWLDEGNTGTKEDFIASLKGEPGETGPAPDMSDYYDKEEIDEIIGDIETLLGGI